MNITTGLCSNGNYPVFDATTGTISCDGSSEPSECQQNINSNIAAVAEYIEGEASCCPASSRAGGIVSQLGFLGQLAGSLAVRKRQVQCDYQADLGRDPFNPPQGECYATWTCPHALFPNVCGNAKSAILHRGATSVLTHHTGSNLHDTSPWYYGRYFAGRADNPRAGWKLEGCEVEEYPFGSGNPDRSQSGDSTLRLIPGRQENSVHGNHIQRWIHTVSKRWRDANNPGGNVRTNGLIYCVAFNDDFTQYLPEDQVDKNICSQPYGPSFGLVTEQRKTDASGNEYRAWDPWFDQIVGSPRKTTQLAYYLTPDGKITLDSDSNRNPSVFLEQPPTYCSSPSPSAQEFVSGQWQLAEGFSPAPRAMNGNVLEAQCTDAEASRAVVKRHTSNATLDYGSVQKRDHARDLLSRQTSGGFLDANIYKYFGCGGGDSDDGDPCAVGDNPCPGRASNPQPTTTLTTEPEPTPTFTVTNIQEVHFLTFQGADGTSFCQISATFNLPGRSPADFKTFSIPCAWFQGNTEDYRDGNDGIQVRFNCDVSGGCGSEFEVEVHGDRGECGRGVTKSVACGSLGFNPVGTTISCYEELVLSAC
ncbi:unnamed protein product [Zymoseptoria tritici ST99CH_3D7]|uniref:Uncharacterized protein n=2 Tax=Zymoseptoria tritici TaxID=1047171 RepID=A0A1X7RS40_ZYMT9|nr:unnamed protein product [Zymoseptoria tritici ST99CH_3D7]